MRKITANLWALLQVVVNSNPGQKSRYADWSLHDSSSVLHYLKIRSKSRQCFKSKAVIMLFAFQNT